MTKTTVADMLEKLGDIYRQRGALYGDNYKRTGARMLSYFPEGLTLRTKEDFNRLGLFVQMDSKMSRYAEAMRRGEGHADSLDDLSVYAQMQQEIDSEARVASLHCEGRSAGFAPQHPAVLTKAIADVLHEVSFINPAGRLRDAVERARALVPDDQVRGG